MQENTESEKPNEEKTPEKEEALSDEKSTSKSSESSEYEPSFEEQEGEVLIPEKKKSSRYRLFLFVLLLLTGGSSYLFYTDQIPPQIKEWIAPLLKPLEQPLTSLKPATAPRPHKKIIPGVKEKVFDPTIQKETVIVENGEIVSKPMMYLALSYDHRIVDGKESVSFLKCIKEHLEEPRRLFLDL